MKIKVLALLALFVLALNSANAQFIEDALRLTNQNGLISPRVSALNIGYYGIADDIGAMLYNPAGLTLIGKNELSASFGFSRNTNTSEFLDVENEFNQNNEFFNHIGFSSPSNFSEKRSAVAVGYFLLSDYNNSYKFNGFNKNNTYIAKSAAQGAPWVKKFLLADDNFNTNIQDSLYQSGFVKENGGAHDISGSIAFDIGDNFGLGFTLSGIWGEYDYERVFEESDILNIYNTANVDDINKLKVTEKLNQSFTGLNILVGFQYRWDDILRVGIGIKTPTWYQVSESFSTNVFAEFDKDNTGKIITDKDISNGENSYNFHTPFTYSAGASFHVNGATISGGVEYTDVTQMEFTDAIDDITALNNDIVQYLVGQVTWGFAAEYQIPMLPVQARASYTIKTSPYQQDIANAKHTYFNLGAGVQLSKNIKLDFLMGWNEISELRANYGDMSDPAHYSDYILKKHQLNLALGVSYRY